VESCDITLLDEYNRLVAAGLDRAMARSQLYSANPY
jgi:hypothetical protein